MVKKILFLIGILLVIPACVITSPAEIFAGTPTICVECVQQTLCAENVDGDACLPASVENQPDPEENETPVPPVDPADNATPTEETGYIKPTRPQFSIFTPTKTPTPTNTVPVIIEPTSTKKITKTPTITKTSTPLTWIYEPQKGAPKYTTNFAHPDLGCNWSGVAGQVFGKNDTLQENVVAVVTGYSNGTPLNLVSMTGAAPAYGEGAFELGFPVAPERTYATIDIQLFDLEGRELSKKYSFDTYSECNKNLVVFNFVLGY